MSNKQERNSELGPHTSREASQKESFRQVRGRDVGNTFAFIREVFGNSRSFAIEGGNKTMSKLAKKVAGLLVGVVVLGMGVMVSEAQAYSDALNDNNTAQITITIRPNVDRSVTITTDNVHMDLGFVSLGAYVSTQTVRPSTVTIGGTIGNTDLLLTANIVGGWSFDNSSSTVEENKLATWMTFTSVSSNTAPTQDGTEYFNGESDGPTSDILGVDTANYPSTRVGTNAATANGRFENLVTSMNGMSPLAGVNQRHMWMFFRMPNATTTADPQLVTFILTVDSGI